MMHKIKEYMEAIKGDSEKQKEVHDILGWGMMKLKMHDEDDYNKMMMKVHCVVEGPHFDEYLAKKAVEKMHNVDGTHGAHWTMEETNRLADQYGCKHKADWFYVLNMMYSDYANVFGTNVETYAKMAKAYLTDPDAEDGKAFKTYIATH